jgi:hypothetical protein
MQPASAGAVKPAEPAGLAGFELSVEGVASTIDA